MRRALRALVVAGLLLCCGACGYRLVGRGGALPPGVSTVSVSTFRNRTDRYGLEADATQVFIRRFMADGTTRVVSAGEADARCEGTLLSYVTTPIAYNAQRQVRERRLVVTARIDFFLRSGEGAARRAVKGKEAGAPATAVPGTPGQGVGSPAGKPADAASAGEAGTAAAGPDAPVPAPAEGDQVGAITPPRTVESRPSPDVLPATGAERDERKGREKSVKAQAALQRTEGGPRPWFSDPAAWGRADYPVTDNIVRDAEAERDALRRALEDLAERVVGRITEGF